MMTRNVNGWRIAMVSLKQVACASALALMAVVTGCSTPVYFPANVKDVCLIASRGNALIRIVPTNMAKAIFVNNQAKWIEQFQIMHGGTNALFVSYRGIEYWDVITGQGRLLSDSVWCRELEFNPKSGVAALNIGSSGETVIWFVDVNGCRVVSRNHLGERCNIIGWWSDTNILCSSGGCNGASYFVGIDGSVVSNSPQLDLLRSIAKGGWVCSLSPKAKYVCVRFHDRLEVLRRVNDSYELVSRIAKCEPDYIYWSLDDRYAVFIDVYDIPFVGCGFADYSIWDDTTLEVLPLMKRSFSYTYMNVLSTHSGMSDK